MRIRITNRPKKTAIDWFAKEKNGLPDFSIDEIDRNGVIVSLDESDADDFMELSEVAGLTCYKEDDVEQHGTPRITSVGKKKDDFSFRMPKYRP